MARSFITIHVPKWRLGVVRVVLAPIQFLVWTRLWRPRRGQLDGLGEHLAAFLVRGSTIGRRRRR